MMKYALGLLACLFAAHLPSAASAQSFGEWGVSARQGYQEHIVSNGPGNSFNITCDIGAAGDGEPKRTSIFIEIVGKPPAPKSLADVFVIDEVFRLPVDEKGVIGTDCRVCAGSFMALWTKLRKSSVMVVQLSDGRSSKFKTTGAAKALASKPCETGTTP
ncbi:hypothetical protein [Methylobacterium cerastii]|uniref:hypothetical protein n=1 Tax=Methylobacterium cerastii TaxID=932741 RepID=UPI001EE2E977|nr:hypothetical protein [Methylobacterium cerastii]